MMCLLVPTTDVSRVLAPTECPLSLQLDWPKFNSYHFELRIQENVHRVKVCIYLHYIAALYLLHICTFQFSLDLPLCSETEVELTLSSSATTTEAVRSILGSLCLTDKYFQHSIKCAIMDVTSRTRGRIVETHSVRYGDVFIVCFQLKELWEKRSVLYHFWTWVTN